MNTSRVLIFPKLAEAGIFIQRLEKGIAQRHRDYISNRITPMAHGPADVEVYLLDSNGARQFALARGKHPNLAEAFVFLNGGAVKACEELGLDIQHERFFDERLPASAKLVINQEFRTRTPYAEIKS